MAFGLETGTENVVSIKVVGVGGGGNNVVNRMVRGGMQGVDFVAVNTDKQALNASSANYKVQIGEKLTGGKGAGSNPDVGRKAAEESRNQLAKAMENTDMVFITAGMGGGTGTGAAPIVAEIAREQGILTVGVVTTPFKWEGARRMRDAQGGIAQLREKVDSLVIIPNERLKLLGDKSLSMKDAFGKANEVLWQGVKSISDTIKVPGYINLDFADVSTIMRGAGYAHMAIGHGSGKDKAKEAANAVISSPLLETSISGAKRLLINIAMSEDILSSDVDAATKMITDTASENVEFIFGTAFKEDMQDEMTITVIAAGFDDPNAPAVEEESQAENAEEEVIPIDNPLIDGLGFGNENNNGARQQSSQDYDLDDIFKMLGN